MRRNTEHPECSHQRPDEPREEAVVGPEGNVRTSGTMLRGALAELPERAVAVVRPPDPPCSTMAEVVDRYEGYVVAIIRNAGLGEDEEVIAQEVFLAMNQVVRDEGMPVKIRGMLAKITSRRIADRMRDLGRARRRASGVDPDAVPSSVRDPEQACLAAERVHQVQTILSQLDEDARSLLVQVTLCGETAESIAKSRGRRPATVRWQLMRARQKFVAVARRLFKLEPGGSR